MNCEYWKLSWLYLKVRSTFCESVLAKIVLLLEINAAEHKPLKETVFAPVLDVCKTISSSWSSGLSKCMGFIVLILIQCGPPLRWATALHSQ